MTKILTIFGWVCAAGGAVMMLLGIISVFAGGYFLDSHWKNYFYPGVGFVIAGIFLIIAVFALKHCECCCEGETKQGDKA